MNFARIRLFSDRTIVFYYQPDLKTSFPSVFDNDEAVELVFKICLLKIFVISESFWDFGLCYDTFLDYTSPHMVKIP